MMRTMRTIACALFIILASWQGFSSYNEEAGVLACLQGTFSKTTSGSWNSISLKITNTCGVDVNVQNATITFTSADNLNTVFWGDFQSISYPDQPRHKLSAKWRGQLCRVTQDSYSRGFLG